MTKVEYLRSKGYDFDPELHCFDGFLNTICTDCKDDLPCKDCWNSEITEREIADLIPAKDMK